MTKQFVLVPRASDRYVWEEMSARDEALCIYSDMYKDANGFRPRGIRPEVTAGQLYRECNALSRQMKAEREYNAQARIQRKLEAAREKEATRKATEAALTRREWTIGDFFSF